MKRITIFLVFLWSGGIFFNSILETITWAETRGTVVALQQSQECTRRCHTSYKPTVSYVPQGGSSAASFTSSYWARNPNQIPVQSTVQVLYSPQGGKAELKDGVHRCLKFSGMTVLFFSWVLYLQHRAAQEKRERLFPDDDYEKDMV